MAGRAATPTRFTYTSRHYRMMEPENPAPVKVVFKILPLDAPELNRFPVVLMRRDPGMLCCGM